MTAFILDIKHISKNYRKTRALNNVSLNMQRGEVYGLIGRNGAGKTTLMRVISGLTHPDSGEIKLFGEAVQEKTSLFERIGVLIENPAVYPQLTAMENMKLLATAIGLQQKEQVPASLELVGLSPDSKKKVKHFSLGMKQRLGIAMAILNNPDILLLDEPANGLDPEGIIQMRRLFRQLAREKQIAVMISSHQLDELARVADRIGIIDHGEMIEEVSMAELIKRCQDKIVIQASEIDAVVNTLEREFKIQDFKVVDSETVELYEQLSELAEINRQLVQAGHQIRSIQMSQTTLESYFIDKIGGLKNA